MKLSGRRKWPYCLYFKIDQVDGWRAGWLQIQMHGKGQEGDYKEETVYVGHRREAVPCGVQVSTCLLWRTAIIHVLLMALVFINLLIILLLFVAGPLPSSLIHFFICFRAISFLYLEVIWPGWMSHCCFIGATFFSLGQNFIFSILLGN